MIEKICLSQARSTLSAEIRNAEMPENVGNCRKLSEKCRKLDGNVDLACGGDLLLWSSKLPISQGV